MHVLTNADKRFFIEFIGILSRFSASSLDVPLARACEQFSIDEDDPVIFLRNLRDVIVHSSGGSSIIVRAISATLMENRFEETKKESTQRIGILERLYTDGRADDWVKTSLFKEQ